jgi:hypothetical protein
MSESAFKARRVDGESDMSHDKPISSYQKIPPLIEIRKLLILVCFYFFFAFFEITSAKRNGIQDDSMRTIFSVIFTDENAIVVTR